MRHIANTSFYSSSPSESLCQARQPLSSRSERRKNIVRRTTATRKAAKKIRGIIPAEKLKRLFSL